MITIGSLVELVKERPNTASRVRVGERGKVINFFSGDWVTVQFDRAGKVAVKKSDLRRVDGNFALV